MSHLFVAIIVFLYSLSCWCDVVHGVVLINGKPFSIMKWKGHFEMNETFPVLSVAVLFTPSPVNSTITTNTTSTTGGGVMSLWLSGAYVHVHANNLQNSGVYKKLIDTLDALQQLQQLTGVTTKGVLLTIQNEQDNAPFAFAMKDFQFPIAVVDLRSIKVLLSPSKNATVLSMDPNGMALLYYSPVFQAFSVIMTLLCVLNFLIALRQLYLWRSSLELSISILCLSLECTACMIRLLQSILYPYMPRYPLPGLLVLMTLYFPFGFSSSILLLFFWLDLVSGSLYSGKLLSVMKIPAAVVCVFLFVFEVAADVVRFMPVMTEIISVMVLMYSGVVYAIAVFYFYTVSRVWCFSKTLKSSRARIKRITIRIAISGVLLAVGFTLVILASLLASRSRPLGCTLWFIFNITLICNSCVQVMVFEPPKLKTTRTKSELSSGLTASSNTTTGSLVKVASAE